MFANAAGDHPTRPQPGIRSARGLARRVEMCYATQSRRTRERRVRLLGPRDSVGLPISSPACSGHPMSAETERRHTMNILLWVVQVLAALLFGASGVMKVF